MVRVFPHIIGVAAGGVDGALEVNDIRHGRVSNARQYSTWFEAAMFGGGLVLNLMRFSPDVTDPLTLGGVALLGRRGGMALMQSQTTTPPPAAMRTFASARAGDIYGMNRTSPTGVFG